MEHLLHHRLLLHSLVYFFFCVRVIYNDGVV